MVVRGGYSPIIFAYSPIRIGCMITAFLEAGNIPPSRSRYVSSRIREVDYDDIRRGKKGKFLLTVRRKEGTIQFLKIM